MTATQRHREVTIGTATAGRPACGRTAAFGGAVAFGSRRSLAEAALPPHTNHDFTYTYDPARPHQARQIGDTLLTYDPSGNTKTECRDHADPTCSINRDHYREYNWTEDNRLASVIDGGGRNITKFVYDAAGERMVKYGRGGASITVGQFFNVKGRTAATKHIFAGTARLASKLLPPAMWASPMIGTPVTAPATTTQATTVTTSTGATATNPVGDGSPNSTGCIPSDYQPQKCPILGSGDPVVPVEFTDTKVRPETYYYHPDHLGSTSWVTDQNGRVHEHVEYFPYGEVWREPKSDRDGAGVKGQRFLFSGKELDEETGLYYFGARYYDPVRVRWASVDPADRFNAKEGTGPLNPYQYAMWSPLRLIDPDGRRECGPNSTVEHHRRTTPATPTWGGTEGMVPAHGAGTGGAPPPSEAPPAAASTSVQPTNSQPGAATQPATTPGGPSYTRPIFAFSGGLVIRVGWQDPNDHGKGYGFRLKIQVDPQTVEDYGHTEEGAALVNEGDTVVQGQLLSQVASPTNGESSGPHLHFNQRKNGQYVPVQITPSHSPVGPGAVLSHDFYEPRNIPLGYHAGYDFHY